MRAGGDSSWRPSRTVTGRGSDAVQRTACYVRHSRLSAWPPAPRRTGCSAWLPGWFALVEERRCVMGRACHPGGRGRDQAGAARLLADGWPLDAVIVPACFGAVSARCHGATAAGGAVGGGGETQRARGAVGGGGCVVRAV